MSTYDDGSSGMSPAVYGTIGVVLLIISIGCRCLIWNRRAEERKKLEELVRKAQEQPTVVYVQAPPPGMTQVPLEQVHVPTAINEQCDDIVAPAVPVAPSAPMLHQ
ncbi:hypothetical protein RI367_002782 [Sorochytrium milnesiophthora]